MQDLMRMASFQALESGWWEDFPGGYAGLEDVKAGIQPTPEQHFWITTKLFLMISEIVESHDDIRNGHNVHEIWSDDKGKPCGFPTELADVVIRIMDMAGNFDIDLEAVIILKMEANRKRGYKHGGKVS